MAAASYGGILKLVWPLALGMVNNAVMQFVDGAFLARESMESLEASLPASMLALTVLGFFQSVVAYSGTFVAQYHGAGDGRMCRASYRAGVALACLAGVVCAAVTPLGALVLETVSDPGPVLSRELAYYRIVSLGGVFLFLQMAAASYLTGLGRTRTVFAVNVAGNAVNIALDPLLIFGGAGMPGMGMAGAACATVFSTFVQWAALAWCASRAHAAGAPCRQGGGTGPVSLALRILRFGVPSGAYSALNILSFTAFVFVTARVGDVAFAVSNACFKVNYLLIAPMEGFAIGAATLVGQAQGRGDGEGAMHSGLKTVLLAVASVSVLSLLAVLFHGPILSMFAPADPAAAAEFMSTGFVLFLLMAAWQVFDAADVVISGALKGAGDTRFVMWWMLAVAFGLWLPMVWAVAATRNTMPALWSTMVVYVFVMCAGSLVRWRRGRWRSITVVRGADRP